MAAVKGVVPGEGYKGVRLGRVGRGLGLMAAGVRRSHADVGGIGVSPCAFNGTSRRTAEGLHHVCFLGSLASSLLTDGAGRDRNLLTCLLSCPF